MMGRIDMEEGECYPDGFHWGRIKTHPDYAEVYLCFQFKIPFTKPRYMEELCSRKQCWQERMLGLFIAIGVSKYKHIRARALRYYKPITR